MGKFSFAQNIRFNKAFPIIPGLAASAWDGIMNEPNGYIMYGPTLDSNGHQDPAIAKIDSEGNTLWQKYFPRIGFNFLPFGGANELGINVPWGGQISEVDWTKDTSNFIGYWGLYRFDGNGDTLWTKNYQDTADVFTDQIVTTREKKYLIYGSYINYADHYHGFNTLFLRKMDTLGNEIWRNIYHATDSNTMEATGIDTCRDGGYILCAYDYDTNTNYSKLACNAGEIVVMKTDSGGNTQWVTYIPDTLCNVGACSIRTLKNGGYAICGTWDDSLSNRGNIAWSRMYLAKLNENGRLVWNRTYGVINEAGEDVLHNLRELLNGDIVACGFGDTLEKSPPGAILRTDSNGNQKWLRYYYKFYPEDADNLTDLQLTSDGGFVASGNTYSSPENFWIVKTDSLGCDTIGCNFNTGINEIKENEEGVKVYPNPNNGSFTISLSNITDKCNVEIYNVLGESIYKAGLNSDNTEINLGGQSAGVYFYRVLKETGELVASGKIVVEK